MPECIDKDLLSLNIKYKAKGLSSHNFKYGADNHVSCPYSAHLDFCHVKRRRSKYQPILTWSYYASADVTHFYPAEQSHLFFIKQFDRECPTESVCLCIFPTPRLSLANMHKGLLHWAYISATSKHKQNKGLHKRASEDIWRPNFVGWKETIQILYLYNVPDTFWHWKDITRLQVHCFTNGRVHKNIEDVKRCANCFRFEMQNQDFAWIW